MPGVDDFKNGRKVTELDRVHILMAKLASSIDIILSLLTSISRVIRGRKFIVPAEKLRVGRKW
jgi:hypothetical protein